MMHVLTTVLAQACGIGWMPAEGMKIGVCFHRGC